MITLRELCETVGVTRRAVQGYEKAGLVKPSGRNERGYLLYDGNAQLVVRKVRQLQSFGFSIREITRLMSLTGSELCRELVRRKQLLEQQKTELERLLAEISRLIDLADTRPGGG